MPDQRLINIPTASFAKRDDGQRDDKMPNKFSFGQRIANIWQELVEHLNTISINNDEPPPQDGEQETFAAGDGEK